MGNCTAKMVCLVNKLQYTVILFINDSSDFPGLHLKTVTLDKNSLFHTSLPYHFRLTIYMSNGSVIKSIIRNKLYTNTSSLQLKFLDKHWNEKNLDNLITTCQHF